MSVEGKNYNMFDALYWSLTIFTTLGLGDIVFESSMGRIFTMWVLFSGIFSFFIITPYAFFKFFQADTRLPRKLSKGVNKHIIIVGNDQITETLIRYLKGFNKAYVIIVEDLIEGLRLYDAGINAIIGKLNERQTYINGRIDCAALVVSCTNDNMNANINLTVREIRQNIPIISTASASGLSTLSLSGATHCVSPDLMISSSLVRRVVASDAIAHIVGVFENLNIAEATAANTPLIGKTLAECNLRNMSGVNVIGVWERGEYINAGPKTAIHENSILVLAGSEAQIANYNSLFCIYNMGDPLVLIIGSGSISSAIARELMDRNIEYEIIPHVSQEGSSINDEVFNYALLDQKLQKASAVIITTENDNFNIFLTLKLRALKENIQIISRTVSESNVKTLYSAGADFVLSYAALGANAILNIIQKNDMLILTEGLNMMRLDVPAALASKKLKETKIRAKTGLSVIAIQTKDELIINPSPEEKLPASGKMYIVGNVKEEKLRRLYRKN
jgi:Trk K+ transport system NAD-binding subunit